MIRNYHDTFFFKIKNAHISNETLRQTTDDLLCYIKVY